MDNLRLYISLYIRFASREQEAGYKSGFSIECILRRLLPVAGQKSMNFQ